MRRQSIKFSSLLTLTLSVSTFGCTRYSSIVAPGTAALAVVSDLRTSGELVQCAAENEFCKFSGSATIQYGAVGKFLTKDFVDGVMCTKEAFGGDPAPGVAKICSVIGATKPSLANNGSLVFGIAPMLFMQDMHSEGMKAFEKWSGRSGLFALEFAAQETWDSLVSDVNWASGIWAEKDPSRLVMWSIPLTTGPNCNSCGTLLSEVAAGAGDVYFKEVAASIAGNQPNALIRIGWEMNGGWYPWAANGHEQDYINAFRRVVGIFRKASPKFQFVWCPNLGWGEITADHVYPGDDVVDIVGVDIYDDNYENEPDAGKRFDNIVNEAFGLQWQVDFANARAKKLAVPEWGVGQAGDNPIWMARMSKWLRDNNYSYASYWEGGQGSGYNSEIESGQYPLQGQAYKDNF